MKNNVSTNATSVVQHFAARRDSLSIATAASEEENAKRISDRAKQIVKTSKLKISLSKAYQLAESQLLSASSAGTIDEQNAKKISDRAKELVRTSKPRISLSTAYQRADAELSSASA